LALVLIPFACCSSSFFFFLIHPLPLVMFQEKQAISFLSFDPNYKKVMPKFSKILVASFKSILLLANLF
jgi:hypothetical protein